MAQVTITTTERQDRAVVLATAQHNAQTGESLTPAQFAISRIHHWLNGLAQTFEAQDQETKGALYRAATPQDQAAIDAILDKYRS